VTHFYTIGLFLKPLEHDFGWSRSEASSGLMIVSAIAVFLSPFTGALIDRLGTRIFGIAGVLIYCAALASLSLSNGSLYIWWATWLLLAIGSLCLKPTVFAAAVSTHFKSGRGLALAVVLCGAGIGAILFPPLTTWFLQNFSWRIAYLALSIFGLVLTLPLILLYFSDAKDDPRRQKISDNKAQKLTLPGASFPASCLTG